MENFGCLNSSFCFYFVTNLRKKKKIMAYARVHLNLSPPPIRVSALLAGPLLPTPSVSTLWLTP